MYSRVGAPVSSGMEIFYNDGQLQTPNYVAYTNSGVVVGHEAVKQALANPKSTIFDVRRLIGRRLSRDPSLQRDIDLLPYDVVIKDDKPVIKLHIIGKDKFVTPEEVQAEVMKKLRIAAEGYYGQGVKSTIITIPAYFNDDQRQATKDAGALAGLDVLRLVNEPTAASIGYQIERWERSDCEEFVIVYNLGENNVDVTISSIEDGVFEILGTAGDRSVGGLELADAVLDYAIEQMQRKMGKLDLKTAFNMVETLKQHAKEVEQTLSSKPSATIKLDEFSITITQDALKSFYKEFFNRTVKHIEAALSDAKLQKTDIHRLVLTGDPTQVSKIQTFLESFFDNKKVLSAIASDQAVLRGAVYQAEILGGDAGMDWLGAFEITALSLGIETAGGLYTIVIPRSTILPTRKFVNVTTIHDNQSKIAINIFEGERPFVINDKEFGTFELAGLPMRPAGELRIEIGFEMDMNAIVRITARELESGKEVVYQALFDVYSRYSAAEVDAFIMDADAHVEEDSRKRVAVDSNPVVGDGPEFGFVVVPREGEKPARWFWN
ncbi:the 70-Kda heat shock cognate protein from rattus Norvegicus in post-Atp hydrolysis state [Rhexocercosporidium sp. MPI-PUGE-AT-0058]|nr:the 70-Kda heat shock cognate protein from rattus Norvegicus in post-Atp hydrolysis state [Rhexocercosporidium sp. MPI-PUGE-AT-0058]